MADFFYDSLTDDPPRRSPENHELTPARLRSFLGLARHSVAWDGSQWIYIFMAAKGKYCAHERVHMANATECKRPSKIELANADKLRLAVADEANDPALKKGPVYDDSGLKTFGESCDVLDFSKLCKVLDDSARKKGVKHYAIDWRVDADEDKFGRNPDARMCVISSEGPELLFLNELFVLLSKWTTAPIHFTHAGKSYENGFDVLLQSSTHTVAPVNP